jgi:hypothetical protein
MKLDVDLFPPREVVTPSRWPKKGSCIHVEPDGWVIRPSRKGNLGSNVMHHDGICGMACWEILDT